MVLCIVLNNTFSERSGCTGREVASCQAFASFFDKRQALQSTFASSSQRVAVLFISLN